MTKQPRTYTIHELDRDYHTLTGVEYKKFKSDKEAQDYCDKSSWSGYYYFFYKEDTK